MFGQFFFHKKLIIPPGNDPVVVVNGNSGDDDIFEKYYASGLGFTNEKNLERKRSGHFMAWPNSEQILKWHHKRLKNNPMYNLIHKHHIANH